MNSLPDNRKIWLGRTHSRAWSPSDFEPICRDNRRSGRQWLDWVMVAMAVGLAVVYALGVL